MQNTTTFQDMLMTIIIDGVIVENKAKWDVSDDYDDLTLGEMIEESVMETLSHVEYNCVGCRKFTSAPESFSFKFFENGIEVAAEVKCQPGFDYTLEMTSKDP